MDSEDRMVSALTYKNVRRTNTKLEGFPNTASNIQRFTDNVAEGLSNSAKEEREKEEQQKLEERLQYKTLGKVYLRHKQLENECTPGTGDWLLASNLSQDWAEGRITDFYLLGPAGVGKSHLAVRIIQTLERMYPSASNKYPVVSFA